ncbi:hypothetical protein HGH92_08370 [Chitinophaga varians]|uniref:Uncharacterized protein n=1 Tax=Chitinophaga varians TaxID=2202339 RepID=A0A847RUA9_9BACT|nr:hypothetical protein [Chitinophaga varians]NLR64317.1 hypothetical protein [Chitinophaga varians]
MIPATTITTTRNNLPCWLVAMLLLCSTAFYLPLEGNNCDRPSVQDELVYQARCCKGKSIGYFRALAACIPSCSYRPPVAYILAFTEQQTCLALRCAAETCRCFETIRHLPQPKIFPEPLPADALFI